RLRLGGRPGEGLVAPRIPVDGVVRVLQQVRARLEDQAVGVAWRAVGPEMPGMRVMGRPLFLERGRDFLLQLGTERCRARERVARRQGTRAGEARRDEPCE